jgi:hypothetical protein
MSTYVWRIKPISAAVSLNPRDPDAGALLSWAGWAADSLFYLQGVDALAFGEGGLGGRHDGVVEIAHFRWAASTAVTALDLGAAAIGKLHGVALPYEHELDLQAAHDRKRIRLQLSLRALQWVDSVSNDARYQFVVSARHPMVHRRAFRDFGLGERLAFRFKDASGTDIRTTVPALLSKATAVTTEHLETLFAEVAAGRI